jgi:hypothetical protein
MQLSLTAAASAVQAAIRAAQPAAPHTPASGATLPSSVTKMLPHKPAVLAAVAGPLVLPGAAALAAQAALGAAAAECA